MDDSVDVRARIPADIDQPDRILWSMNARQVAILAVAAVAAYLLWRYVGARQPLVAIAEIPLLGLAAAVALGRRDGLSLDAWLWAALRYRRQPCRTVPAPEGITVAPDWAPVVEQENEPRPQLLRLPAQSIGDEGVIDLGDGSAVVLVAVTTIHVGLRTPGEQAALIAGYARWLNSLTGPVQIVVSAQRVDLTSHAQRVAGAAGTLPNDALADAAIDYANFLCDISEQRDPLWRTVTIACTATGGAGAPAEAMRRAAHTATALAALGAQTRVLDGPTAAAVLTAAVDPYTPSDASWARATAHRPVTAPLDYPQEPTR